MNPLQEYLDDYKLPLQIKVASSVYEEAESRFGVYAGEIVEACQDFFPKASSAEQFYGLFGDVERQLNMDMAVMCKVAGVPYSQVKDLPFAEKIAKGEGMLTKGVKGVGNFLRRFTVKGRSVKLPELPKPGYTGGPTSFGSETAGTVAKITKTAPRTKTVRVPKAKVVKRTAKAAPAKTPGQTVSTGGTQQQTTVNRAIQGPTTPQPAGKVHLPSATSPEGAMVVRRHANVPSGTGIVGFQETTPVVVYPDVSNTMRTNAAGYVTPQTLVSKQPALAAAAPKGAKKVGPAAAVSKTAPTTTLPPSQPTRRLARRKLIAPRSRSTYQVRQRGGALRRQVLKKKPGGSAPGKALAHTNPKVNAIVSENPELAKMMQPGGATSPTEILRASGGNLSAGQQHTLLSTHYTNLQSQLSKGGLNAAETKGIQNAMAETNNMMKQLGSTAAPIQEGMFGGYGGFGGVGGTSNLVKSLRWPAAGVGAVYLGSKALGGGQQAGYRPQGY